MKKIILFTAFTLVCLLTFGQEGVNFEHLTFEQALTKAKTEKKMVFMDCYTAWCGPCKYMTEHIFPLKEAGDYFNTRFISVKYDMEKGEGKELAKRYKVTSYPTFFLIRPDGSVQHKIVGSGSLEVFIAKIEQGLTKKTSLDYLEKKYDKGKISKKETMSYLSALSTAHDYEKSAIVSKELEVKLNDKDKLQAEFWPLVVNKGYGTETFNFIYNNLHTLRQNVGQDAVDNYIYSKFDVIINQCKNGRGDHAQKILATVRQQLSDIELHKKEDLLSKLYFAEACAQENIDQVITIAENLIQKRKADIDLWPILSPFSDWVKDKATKEQLTKIARLGDDLMRQIENEKLKEQLQYFFESFKILSGKEVYFHDLTFNEAQQKAKQQGKMLFIDCYTSWCGPCMYMANVVFKQERMADFLNKRFICVKYDLESSKGTEIQKKYHVEAYPTFIILNSDGSLRHQFVGGGEADIFIKKVEMGLNDETALGTQIAKYEQGCRDKKFLTAYMKTLTELCSPQAMAIANELFSQLDDSEKTSRDFWFITGNVDISPRGSEIEKYVLENRKIFSETIGEEEVNHRLLNGYMKEVMMILVPRGAQSQATTEDLDVISRQVTALKLKNNKVYQGYIKIAKARKSGNIDHFITVCEQEYTKDFNKSLIYNMGGVGSEATKTQRERWDKFLKRVGSTPSPINN